MENRETKNLVVVLQGKEYILRLSTSDIKFIEIALMLWKNFLKLKIKVGEARASYMRYKIRWLTFKMSKTGGTIAMFLSMLLYSLIGAFLILWLEYVTQIILLLYYLYSAVKP